MVRRVVEQAFERTDKALVLSALDWAKAFDSLFPSGLLYCLARLSVPARFRALIGTIYNNRQFFVRHTGSHFMLYPQAFGIVLGCLLSPFLPRGCKPLKFGVFRFIILF